MIDGLMDRLFEYARQRGKRLRGEHDWWDDEWRVERARAEGIRFSDEELVHIGSDMLLGSEPPDLSFNECNRALDLAYREADPK